MKYQDYIIDTTKKAAEEAFRYAKAVQADKVNWKASDTVRTVLDICQEMAQCPLWCQNLVEGKKMEFNEDTQKQIMSEREQWQTVEACEAECNRRLDNLFAAIRSFPDERLSETQWLPFDGGRDFTMVEMMDYPRWNFNYHTGQIAYVQTIYGDKGMY